MLVGKWEGHDDDCDLSPELKRVQLKNTVDHLVGEKNPFLLTWEIDDVE